MDPARGAVLHGRLVFQRAFKLKPRGAGRRFKMDRSGASSDHDLLSLWLSGRPDSTRRVYEPVALAFLQALGSVRAATVADVVRYVETLEGEPATRARLVATIKSLLSFAWRTGYTAFNVGRALRCVRVPSSLHERIVDEETVKDVVGSADGRRDHALLRLLYSGGLRISEAVKLRWVDVEKTRVHVKGKGAKSRTVLIPEAVGLALLSLKAEGAGKHDPVFVSRLGRQLCVRAARDAVYKAAREAGVKLSPHWFRHAHASHAIDRGCPIHVVQRGLGHENVATTSKYLHVRATTGVSQWLPEV